MQFGTMLIGNNIPARGLQGKDLNRALYRSND